MKKLIILLFLLLSFSVPSQDVVYDSIIGNKNYWRRIKYGTSETILNTYYQNEGIIAKSKVLIAAGVFEGIVENEDYVFQPLNNDTLIFEFRSDEPLNLIFYKYYFNNESNPYNFFGLRKANLGDNMFNGKYLFICPIIPKSTINIYTGIGTKRKLFMSFKGNEINESIFTDYNVPSEMTFQVIGGSKQIIYTIIKEFILDENNFDNRVAIWPNPVYNNLNVKIVENPGVILKIYDNKPLLLYQEYVTAENVSIDVTPFLAAGLHILVLCDYKRGNILYVGKVIVLK